MSFRAQSLQKQTARLRAELRIFYLKLLFFKFLAVCDILLEQVILCNVAKLSELLLIVNEVEPLLVQGIGIHLVGHRSQELVLDFLFKIVQVVIVGVFKHFPARTDHGRAHLDL